MGIHKNVPLKKLLDLGFKIIFDELYFQQTTLEDLIQIRYKCKEDTLICIAGINSIYCEDIL